MIFAKKPLQIAGNPHRLLNFGCGHEIQIKLLQIPRIDIQRHLVQHVRCCCAVCHTRTQAVVHYADGHAALKGTGRQPARSDLDFWCSSKHFLFAYAINVSLVRRAQRMVLQSSGLDHITSLQRRNALSAGWEHLLLSTTSCRKECRKHLAPVQPTRKKATLMIRDLHLWHAGMPSNTREPRIMLAFGVQSARCHERAGPVQCPSR